MVKKAHRLFEIKDDEDYYFNIEETIQESLNNNTGDSIFTNIEAGHTYLGQMIAHDIVPSTTLHLNRKKINPTLNLDSLYGDENNPAFFDKEGKFILGFAESPSGHMVYGKDLLRGKDLKALIPEDRNDENIITSQLHLFWQKFHNVIIDELKTKHDNIDNYFECTKFIITKLFHEIVEFDYMKQIIHPEIYKIYKDGCSFFYKKDNFSEIPIEFSHAVFRFGHSMVREEYNLSNNSHIKIADKLSNRDLKLSTHDVIDWGLFFTTFRISDSLFLNYKYTDFANFRISDRLFIKHESDDSAKKAKKTKSGFAVQHSMRIDTSIISGMNSIPFICGRKEGIKRINLNAGLIFEMNFGFKIKNEIEKLEEFKDIFYYDFYKEKKADLEKLPLWPYILKEAELSSKDCNGLGLLGSIIVSEVIINSIKSVFNHSTDKYECQLNEIRTNIKKHQLSLERKNIPRRSLPRLNSQFLNKPISMGYCINYIN